MGAAPKIPQGSEHHERAEHPFEVKRKGLKKEAAVDASLEETRARVKEVLTPLELDAGDVLTRSGEEILEEKLEKPFVGIIESGSKQPVAISSRFQGADVVAYTTPGLPKPNGEYPENRDGFVMIKTPDGNGLQVVMSHGMSEGPESAALANAASISAGYDLQRMEPPHMTEVFGRVNDQVNGMKKELEVPKHRLSLLGLTMKKDNPDDQLYAIDVMKAGDVHCFVLDTHSGTLVKVTPQTVSATMSKARLPMKRRAEILEKYSKATGATPKRIEGILTMSAGQTDETFRPEVESLMAAPGEVVIVATTDFMKSFGGIEHYYDKTIGQLITAQLKRGKRLNDIIGDLMRRVIKRQQDGEVEDYPMSVVAFQVPEKPEESTESVKQLTVEDVLQKPGEEKPALPEKRKLLDLDFSDL